MCFLEESYKYMQKIQILKFLRAPSYEIWEYAFKCLRPMIYVACKLKLAIVWRMITNTI